MTGGRAGESEVERLTRLRGKHPQRHRIICHPAEPVIFSKHSDCRLFHRARIVISIGTDPGVEVRAGLREPPW
jgi:hypothetical protein